MSPGADAYEVLPPAKWHLLTPVYDLGCRLLGLGPKFRDSIIERLDLKEGQAVLDVGCGTGVLAARIKERRRGVKVTGLDPTSAALAIAKRRAGKMNLAIEWKEGFAESMPFGDDTFDRVVTSLAFHHVPADKKPVMLKECLRVLRPGGMMLLVDLGEQDTFGARLFIRWVVGFEHLGDQIGRLPQFLSEAGFQGVQRVHRAHMGIGFYRGTKQQEAKP